MHTREAPTTVARPRQSAARLCPWHAGDARAGDAPPPERATSRHGRGTEAPLRFTDRDPEAESLFRETFDRAPVGLAHIGLDGRWLRFNRRLAEFLQRTPAELRGFGIPDVTHPPDLAADLAQFARLVAGEIDEYALEKRYLRKDGSVVWALLHRSAVRGADRAPRYCITVVEDLSARKAAEEELASARVAAEAGSRAKSQFLATISHEIRTPLTAILGYAELLALGLAGPLAERQAEYLERIQRSGHHLLTVVNQVLDFAKIDADRLEVERVEANAADAVEGALALVEPQAATRGLHLSSACGPGAACRYVGDPDRVQQVLVNLLANAVKFTPPGGRITVSCGTTRRPSPDAALPARVGEWVYVRVEDTGTGVAPEQLAAIFEPFEQESGGYTRAHGGTGLGLTISRRLARLMDGDVTLRSQPGVGSVFFVWLPAAPARPTADPLRERRSAARYTPGLSAIGEVALESLEQVVAAYVARLRGDARTPSAARCTDEQLEDHTVTFVADVAQALTLIEAAHGAPSDLIRDGTAIQRVISERHGAQRARLGFAEAEVRREYAILAEELAVGVRRHAGPAPEDVLEQAIGLLERFVEHGARAALRGYRAVGAGASAGGA